MDLRHRPPAGKALHYRKQARHMQIKAACERLKSAGGNGEVARWIVDREAPPADVLASKELALLVRATLTTLTEDHGSILAARYLDGRFGRQQIADAEQCSSTAIRSAPFAPRAGRPFAHNLPGLTDGATGRHVGSVS